MSTNNTPSSIRKTNALNIDTRLSTPDAIPAAAPTGASEHAKLAIQTLLDSFLEDQDTHVQQADNKVEFPWENEYRLQSGLPEEVSAQIESFLVRLIVLYQMFGCPTHIIEVNVPKVAHGLGVHVDVAVFPTFALVSTYRNRRKQLQFHASTSGLDMFRLQLVDELVRRIASYATTEPPKTLTDKAALDTNELTNRLESLQRIPMPDLDSSLNGGRRVSNGSGTEARRISNDYPSANFNPRDNNYSAAAVAAARGDATTNLRDSPTVHRRSSEASTRRSTDNILQAVATEEGSLRGTSTIDLKQMILDLASYGPGFYTPPTSALPGGGSLNNSSTAATKPEVTKDVAMAEFSSVRGDRATTSKLAGGGAGGGSGGASDVLSQLRSRQMKMMQRKHASAFSKIAVEDAMERLSQIMHSKPLYPFPVQCLLTGIAAAGCCGLFFHGNWLDILFALIFGVLVAVIGLLNRNVQFSRVYEVRIPRYGMEVQRSRSSSYAPSWSPSLPVSPIIRSIPFVTSRSPSHR